MMVKKLDFTLKFYSFLLVFIFFFQPPNLFSQQKVFVKINQEYRICTVAGNPVRETNVSVITNPLIERLFLEVCNIGHLVNPSMYEVKEADFNKKYIYYNRRYLSTILDKTKTELALFFVFAHEVGHHLQGHLYGKADTQLIRQQELEADKFAGRAMAVRGAKEEEVRLVVNATLNEKGDSTHPSRRERLETIVKSFNEYLKGKINFSQDTIGAIGFRNLTKAKIRVFRMEKDTWIDNLNGIEIDPNEKALMENIKADFTTFYIEIFCGKNALSENKWKFYSKITEKVFNMDTPPPIDIK
jgi:Peptidase family M48